MSWWKISVTEPPPATCASCERLERDLVEARQDLKAERERNRQREDSLIDRVLVRHNSRPIRPAEEPLPVPSPSISPLDEARRQDIKAEWLDHHQLKEFDMTPHMRDEMERHLDAEMQRPLITRWPQ